MPLRREHAILDIRQVAAATEGDENGLAQGDTEQEVAEQLPSDVDDDRDEEEVMAQTVEIPREGSSLELYRQVCCTFNL